jgi:hypothetical protein
METLPMCLDFWLKIAAIAMPIACARTNHALRFYVYDVST